MEWLAATAENPETRREAVAEIAAVQKAFDKLAAKERRNPDLVAAALRTPEARNGRGKAGHPLDPVVLGAALTETQRRRLSAALVATRRLDRADRSLHGLVRGWDPAAARGWLEKVLPDAEWTMTNVHGATEWLVGLANELDDADRETFLGTARDGWEKFEGGQHEIDDIDEALDHLDRVELALARDLSRELAVLLRASGRPGPSGHADRL
jgi:hypothetical protein